MIRPPALHLASTSPRRREILAALQLEFSVGHVDVDETPQVGEAPADMALRLARAKAEAGNAGTHDLVLAADTVVVVETGVALRGPDGTSTALSETDVYFREISRDEARAYWQSGEPSDKAGAYAIQGLGGVFVVFETVALLREAGLDVVTMWTAHGR
jgi:septum formation protein